MPTQAKFNIAPGPYGPLTYDGMKLLAWAIDNGRLAPTAPR